MAEHRIWVETNRQGIICEGPIEFPFSFPRDRTADIGVRIAGIESNCFIEIGDGRVVVALFIVRAAAVDIDSSRFQPESDRLVVIGQSEIGERLEAVGASAICIGDRQSSPLQTGRNAPGASGDSWVRRTVAILTKRAVIGASRQVASDDWYGDRNGGNQNFLPCAYHAARLVGIVVSGSEMCNFRASEGV